VRTIAVDDFDASMQWHVIAENVKNGLPLDYSPAKGVLGLKADDEYRVSRIAGALSEMVKNPAIFHHP
jgi:hypothetical protein